MLIRPIFTILVYSNVGLLFGCSSGASAETGSPASTDELQRTWSACSSDEQCVLVRGVCGRWVGVNKDHKSSAEAHYQRINMMVRCRQLSEPEYPVSCLHSACVVQRPEPAK